MKYKVIGFDYGGVVEKNSAADFTLNTCKILGIDRKTFDDVYFKYNYLVNTTNINWKDFWKMLLKKWDKEDKEKEFFDFLDSKPKREHNYELLNFIDELKNLGYKICLMSNNSSKLTEIVKKDKIDKYFDMVLISEDIGYMKPYPEFFQISCDRLGIKPEELVFIDDFDRNLINADKVGFTPILYKNLEDLKIKLKELCVI